jgi:hypothetical protein
MQPARCDLQQMLTQRRHNGRTVQAGTPMTVTGNGAPLVLGWRGVFIFRPQISRVGSGEGSALPAFSACAGLWI